MDALIARVRQLGDLVDEAAPEIAKALELELQLQIAAARGPGGAAWAPRKSDGGKALQGAAAQLTVRVVGRVVIARLVGVEARHHLGYVRGGVQRQILPTAGIPDPMVRSIRKVLDRKFGELAGGAVR